jgi:hypothetical protein
MSKLSEYAEFRPAIQAGVENLQKWYWKVDENDAPFITLGELLILQRCIHQC